MLIDDFRKLAPIDWLLRVKYIEPIIWNKQLQKDILIGAKVELQLFFSLVSEYSLCRWLPGVKYDGKWITSVTAHAIDLNNLFYNYNAIDRICFIDNKQYLLSELDEFKGTYFTMTRLYALHNRIKLSDGKYPDRADDRIATYQLADFMKINKEDLFEDVDVPEYFPWQRSYLHNLNTNQPQFKFYNFYGEDGIFYYSLVQTDKLAPGCNPILLPITFWQKLRETWNVHMHIMPLGKHPLYNLHYIKSLEHATIFLTEHIDIAEANSPARTTQTGKPYIWTSWYGGIDAVEHVNWSPLLGRTVYFVLMYNSGDSKERISLALKLYEKFVKNPNMHFRIITWSVRYEYQRGEESPVHDQDSLKYLTDDSLFDFADKYNVHIPDGLLEYRNRFLFDDKVKDYIKAKFLIEPVLKENTLTVLYAPAGIGKSWLAMSCGLALANGKDVFPGWNVPSSKNVYFVSGEMDIDELNNRVLCLKKAYQSSDPKNDKFVLRKVRMDLSKREDQEKIEKDLRDLESSTHSYIGKKISLIIFDNLSTLVSKGSYMSNFDLFFEWLEYLKSKKYSILLVHHSNKESSFLGTSAIKNKTDVLLKADPYDEEMESIEAYRMTLTGEAEDEKEAGFLARKKMAELLQSNDVFFYLVPEKLRSISKKSFKPVKLILNPSDDPYWKVEYMDRKSIRESLDLKDNHQKTESSGSTPCDVQHKSFPKSYNDNILEKPLEEQKVEMFKCVNDQKMTSEKMAKYFGICKKYVDNLRLATCTRRKDLFPNKKAMENQSPPPPCINSESSAQKDQAYNQD